jgi:hypothetical protein
MFQVETLSGKSLAGEMVASVCEIAENLAT